MAVDMMRQFSKYAGDFSFYNRGLTILTKLPHFIDVPHSGQQVHSSHIVDFPFPSQALFNDLDFPKRLIKML